MRHLISTRTLSREDALMLLDTAEQMSEVSRREVKKLPALRGTTVVNLFYEDSTRTRTSFEAAEKRLSADVINFSARGSSVSKGESLKDTVQTLRAIGADIVVIRHPSSGAAQLLADRDWIDAPIVNAGDGTHAHPTQALLDAFTLRRRRYGDASAGRDLAGEHVVIVGDILHSRVARSNAWLLSALGARVTFVGPPTLVPDSLASLPADRAYDFDGVIDRDAPTAVMMLRIQTERMHDAYFPHEREYARLWGLGESRLGRLPEHCLIMHPGPMNRGVEIASAAADSPRSTVREQVANGVAVRMAVLFAVASGPVTESPTAQTEERR